MQRYFFMAMAMLSYMILPFLGIGTAEAASDFEERTANMAEITDLRCNAEEDKVRIVADATAEVDYKVQVLEDPGRVVVDLSGAWISSDIRKSRSIDGQFARKVRIAQFDENTVRIVVETDMGKNPANYDVFSITGDAGEPAYRVVMDFGNLRPSSESSVIGVSEPGDEEVQDEHKETRKERKERERNEKKERKEREKQEKERQKKEAETQVNTERQKAEPSEEQTEKEEIGGFEGVNVPGLRGKRIAIDAGHGGSDVGAIGPSGVTEASITLRVALWVQGLLEASGADVIMTRTTDTEVSPRGARATDVDELQSRCDVANKANADIFISIHMDSFSSGAAHGTTGYYFEGGSAKSTRLADTIRSELVKALGTDSRGTKSCHFYVVKHTSMPAALIEMAFVSNPKEEKLMNSKAGAEKAARAIVRGITRYFGG